MREKESPSLTVTLDLGVGRGSTPFCYHTERSVHIVPFRLEGLQALVFPPPRRPRPRPGGQGQGLPILWRVAPLWRLPPKATRRPGGLAPGVPATIQLLLQRRWLPAPRDATFGPFPRTEGVPEGGGYPLDRHAPRAHGQGLQGAPPTLRCLPEDHRSLADVVEGDVPQARLLEERTSAIHPSSR